MTEFNLTAFLSAPGAALIAECPDSSGILYAWNVSEDPIIVALENRVAGHLQYRENGNALEITVKITEFVAEGYKITQMKKGGT